jgi:Icc-related predicted phosphoesterase
MAEESRLRELYRGIPARTQYLISHGPVYGHVDLTQSKEHAGSLALLERIRTLPNLQYCFTGHIHEAAGVSVEAVTATQRVQFMNCTAVDLSHRVVHPPRIINV